jgi:hypothetical protein
MNAKFIMLVIAGAMLAAAVAATSPSAAPALHDVSSAGSVTAQLAPTEPDMRRPTVCTEQYSPVCGRLKNVARTYPNQCYARTAGAEVISQGPCAIPAPRPFMPPAPR